MDELSKTGGVFKCFFNALKDLHVALKLYSSTCFHQITEFT